MCIVRCSAIFWVIYQMDISNTSIINVVTSLAVIQIIWNPRVRNRTKWITWQKVGNFVPMAMNLDGTIHILKELDSDSAQNALGVEHLNILEGQKSKQDAGNIWPDIIN